MTSAATVGPPDSPEARKYNRIRRWLGICEFALALAMLLILLAAGWSGWLRDLAYSSGFQSYAFAVFLYVLMLALISKALSLPLGLVAMRLKRLLDLGIAGLFCLLAKGFDQLFLGIKHVGEFVDEQLVCTLH